MGRLKKRKTWTNEEEKREYYRKYRDKFKKELVKKLGGKCGYCGTDENLEFDHIDRTTKKFNMADMMLHPRKEVLKEARKCQLLCPKCHDKKTREDGVVRKGEECVLSKLTEKQVRRIRRDAEKRVSTEQLAKRYEVDKRTIENIITRRTWNHI